MGRYEVLLKRMFSEMVTPRDATKIAEFYHPEFWVSTNQVEQTYDDFYSDHVKYYSEHSQMSYAVEYDELSFLENDEGVSGRMWITTRKADGDPTRIEVLLVAKYKDDKIHRLWELTLPNWATMEDFAK